jgi:hypothetical protein
MSANMCRIYLQFPPFVWTETYYRVGETLTQSLIALKSLAQARVAILGGGVILTEIRVATDPPTRATRVDGVSPNQSQSPICESANGLLVRFQADPLAMGGNYWRSSSLRGIPLALFADSEGNPALFDYEWTGVYKTWLQLLCDGSWYLRVSTKEQIWHPVAGVNDFATDDSDVTGEPLDEATLPENAARLIIGLADGAQIPNVDPATNLATTIRLRGASWSGGVWPGGRTINGVYPVLDTLPGAVIVAGKLPSNGTVLPGGFLRQEIVTYVPIARYQIKGISRHRTGGRSSYHKIRQSAPIPPLPQTQAYFPGSPAGPEGLPPEVPAQPVYKTLRSALDLVNEIWIGYSTFPDGNLYPIGIAQILNYPGWWLVVLSGTTLAWSQAAGIPEDIYAALGLEDRYTQNVIRAVLLNVPLGSTLVMAGHSLGGMECWSAQGSLRVSGYTVGGIVTFGAPITVATPFFVPIRRFALPGDTVVTLSPIGVIMALLGNPEQTYLNDPSIPDNVYAAHLGYPQCGLLDQWDPYGVPLTNTTGSTMVLGNMLRLENPFHG